MKSILAFFENQKSYNLIETDYKLSEREKTFLNHRVENLRDYLPLEACITMYFKKEENDKFTGLLKINSLRKEFKSANRGSFIEQVYLLCESEILDQVNEWKRNRFTFNSSDDLEKVRAT